MSICRSAIMNVPSCEYESPANRGRIAYGPYRLSYFERSITAIAGAFVLALLIAARCLEPSTAGMGTHQQLGLPPCTFVALLGTPCPSCGMTTSWALVTRFRLTEAAEVNAGGFILALIALAYVPVSCYLSFTGRSTRGGWFSLGLAICLTAALAIAVIQWSIRLFGT